jgi:short-subunit dehydrogenase
MVDHPHEEHRPAIRDRTINNVLITGASGGLGAALARTYAGPGRRLMLWGRNSERLATTAAGCRQLGATVQESSFDVRDVESMAKRIESINIDNPLDLAIFNAGVGGVSDHPVEPWDRALEIALVNFTATVVGASAVAQNMASRGAGHIVIIGSIAESFPLPMAPTYAGAKAGLRMFAEALELRLYSRGVLVTLISPGFIDTPMSQGLPSRRPFLLTADQAAGMIARSITQRRRRVVIPRSFALVRAISGLLPRAISRAVLRRM